MMKIFKCADGYITYLVKNKWRYLSVATTTPETPTGKKQIKNSTQNQYVNTDAFNWKIADETEGVYTWFATSVNHNSPIEILEFYHDGFYAQKYGINEAIDHLKNLAGTRRFTVWIPNGAEPDFLVYEGNDTGEAIKQLQELRR